MLHYYIAIWSLWRKDNKGIKNYYLHPHQIFFVIYTNVISIGGVIFYQFPMYYPRWPPHFHKQQWLLANYSSPFSQLLFNIGPTCGQLVVCSNLLQLSRRCVVSSVSIAPAADNRKCGRDCSNIFEIFRSSFLSGTQRWSWTSEHLGSSKYLDNLCQSGTMILERRLQAAC